MNDQQIFIEEMLEEYFYCDDQGKLFSAKEEIIHFANRIFEYAKEAGITESIETCEKVKTKFEFFSEEQEDYSLKKEYKYVSTGAGECVYELKMKELA